MRVEQVGDFGPPPSFLVAATPAVRARSSLPMPQKPVGYNLPTNSTAHLLNLIDFDCSVWSDPDFVGLWRNTFSDGLRLWIDSGQAVSQRHFWRFFDALQTETNHIDFCGEFEYLAFRLDAGRAGRIQGKHDRLRSPEFARGFSTDYFQEHQRELSTRRIRWILDAVFQEVEELEEIDSVEAILSFVRTSLVAKVVARVRWRRSVACSRWRIAAPSTRDWVLTFVLHTGISPPVLGASRPGAGWAPVACVTAAQKVCNESVRRRNHRRNLLDAFCAKRAGERISRGSQDRASVGSCVQLGRRRRIWAYSALAQRARASGCAGGREVAPHVRVVQRQGRCRWHSARASLGGRP